MNGVAAKRKFAAILSADVVGYWRLMGDDDRATLAALKALRATMTRHIERHDGRVVNVPGDALLAEFPSAVEALQASVEIQQDLTEQNIEVAEEHRMRVRLGVNLGDILVEPDGTLYGDGVNVAARMETIAEPGGICVSGNVHDFVDGKVDLRFEDIGEQRVKNIAKPVRAYRVERAAAAHSSAASERPLALPDKPSIAVLLNRPGIAGGSNS